MQKHQKHSRNANIISIISHSLLLTQSVRIHTFGIFIYKIPTLLIGKKQKILSYLRQSKKKFCGNLFLQLMRNSIADRSFIVKIDNLMEREIRNKLFTRINICRFGENVKKLLTSIERTSYLLCIISPNDFKVCQHQRSRVEGCLIVPIIDSNAFPFCYWSFIWEVSPIKPIHSIHISSFEGEDTKLLIIG